MSILDLIASLFKPVADTIDELHTSREEKDQALAKLTELKTTLMDRMLAYEAKIIENQSKVIIAEAQGQSWLQRNWRPLLMLTFGFIVAWNYIFAPLFTWVVALFGSNVGVPTLEMTTGFWSLLTAGVTGYVVGRSSEKIAQTLSLGKMNGK